MPITSQGNDSKNKLYKKFTSCSITLKPNTLKQIPLGSYSKSDTEPQFDISTSPDIEEQLGASFEKMDIPGTNRYICFYQVHNFSGIECKVTVLNRNIR
jgi:hypothetical protein